MGQSVPVMALKLPPRQELSPSYNYEKGRGSWVSLLLKCCIRNHWSDRKSLPTSKQSWELHVCASPSHHVQLGLEPGGDKSWLQLADRLT